MGIPVFNGAEHLSATLDSLLGQTLTDFELIISDNASTDATPAICQAYALRDPRIRVLRNPSNVGASENFNTVLRHARAPLFKWASANDLCMPSFLQRCVSALDADPGAVLCCPRTRLFTEQPADGQDYVDDMNLDQPDAVARYEACSQRLKLNNIMNGVVRTHALRQTPLIRPFFSSDSILMTELSLHGRFIEIQDFLFYRRMDPRTATALMGDTQRMAHYNPSGKRMRFQYWRMAWANLELLARVPLGLGQRMRLALAVGRYLRWSRHRLFQDLRSSLLN